VADREARRLLCTCGACYLLFASQGAGGDRYRGLPDQARVVADLSLSPEAWEGLEVPVELAFLFRRADVDGYTACYPGPGGATESLLDLEAWDEVVAANPVLGTVEPDVEAVLLRRRGGRTDCYLVPIDACYELVGIARRHWSGFHGGPEVWQHIDAFFSDLDGRSRPVTRDGEVLARG
jgi:hypothetical protein